MEETVSLADATWQDLLHVIWSKMPNNLSAMEQVSVVLDAELQARSTFPPGASWNPTPAEKLSFFSDKVCHMRA